MADLSSYTPLYVRTTGNDTTGNGTLAAPYRTAQRAFTHALFEGGTPATAPTPERLEVTVSLGDGTGLTLEFEEIDPSTGGAVMLYMDGAAYDNPADDAALAAALAAAYTGSGTATASGNVVTFTAPVYDGTFFNDSTIGGTALVESHRFSRVSNLGTLGTGNYVLDFGAGTFSGVTLRDVSRGGAGYIYYYNPDWPSRIAVRGAGAAQSFLGGVNGGGSPYYDNNGPTPLGLSSGRAVHIVSDGSVNLGVVTASGALPSSMTDAQFGEITSGGSSAGSVTLIDCVCGNVLCVGGDAGTSGGEINLTGVTCADVMSYGGDGNQNAGGGGGNNVTLTNCSVGNVDAKGGADWSWNFTSGAPGSVSATDTAISGGINVSFGDPSLGTPQGYGGVVTLAGSTAMPTHIYGASSVSMPNLRRGRGVNGSGILGIA